MRVLFDFDCTAVCSDHLVGRCCGFWQPRFDSHSALPGMALPTLQVPRGAAGPD